MKVIIVTDLHDDFDFKSKANVQIKTKNGVIYRTHLKIKPLPTKVEDMRGEADYDFWDGWNACLEGILGNGR